MMTIKGIAFVDTIDVVVHPTSYMERHSSGNGKDAS